MDEETTEDALRRIENDARLEKIGNELRYQRTGNLFDIHGYPSIDRSRKKKKHEIDYDKESENWKRKIKKWLTKLFR